MWEPDFSLLGKREGVSEQAGEERALEKRTRTESTQTTEALRKLILEAPPVRCSLTTNSPLPSLPSLPPLLVPAPRAPSPPPAPPAPAAPAALAVAGPDPRWSPWQHAGLFREIGGLEGFYSIFVHKTRRLPSPDELQ
mgnify:CR=1 FL=1